MKSKFYILLLITSISFLTSCIKNSQRGGYESYRYELWKLLLDNNYHFDFIGTQVDNRTYPQHLGLEFDPDHEGTAGLTTGGILANLNDVLENIQTPDIVLLGIGSNDMILMEHSSAHAIENINHIIDKLQNNNPNVTIFLEQIAPGNPGFMTNRLQIWLNNFNTQIITVSNNKTNLNSKVIVVDMYTEFSADYFKDKLHYNEEGAFFIAYQYFIAIQNQFVNTDSLTILTLGDSRVQGKR